MKGFEVLGYPLWNHIHHGFNNPDSYVKYAYGNFNNGCMDCDGSEDYVVFQTNTAKFMTNLAAYIEKINPNTPNFDNTLMLKLFDLVDNHVESHVLSSINAEKQVVNYIQSVYTREIGEKILEVLHQIHLTIKNQSKQ
ncbi:MAG: hypothetical protein BWX56_00294 [Euryarchaeota archaeon ADurb.Bin023]|jgi:hypothetical protein|uniref:Uncharacterized protein n=1 Tax=Candidatus Methanofastidiosum methylothiophilum TaxID=1705564 RepID=A0A150JKD5_9EURY|nr:MAG: hypothetical protein APG09_00957 [Candidatus Methanofastidiosum methylthiophilus]NOJ28695.1 hypothetical protein [Nitrososphaeraceae archaeon]OQC52406.1 MAG: hypothetical protein BWX56_00294 [Euryarchaeota archaeon ADurb.Bin023]